MFYVITISIPLVNALDDGKLTELMMTEVIQADQNHNCSADP